MEKETKYGVISDVHQNPGIVPMAIEVLKKLGAEKLLINGDIGSRKQTLEESQNYTAFILDSIGKSGLEAYVQPGSHETLLAFGPVLDHFSSKYSNIMDATKNRKIEQNGHQLIFLPGSDFTCGGEYQLGNDEKTPSGRIMQTLEGCFRFNDWEQYLSALNKGIVQGAFQYVNMQDLRKLATNPDKAIVVCHVPRKFDNAETCVDMAEFGEVAKNFFADIIQYKDGESQIKVFYKNGESGTVIGPKPVETFVRNQSFGEGDVFPISTAKEMADAGAPVEIKRTNRGNKDLKNLYEELGIKKAVSGHFHESGHRANDGNGNHVQEGQMVSELFWNSGHLDAGQTGILAVNDGKASYRNINLQDYLK
jgi:hypothetical protein